MGYYHIWKKNPEPLKLSRVAVSILEKSLGDWRRGHSRWHPGVHVEMVSLVSRRGGSTGINASSRLLQRMRSWLGLF